MEVDSREPSSTRSSRIHEGRSPNIGLLWALAIGAWTMIAEGILVLSGVAVSDGDLCD